jgi:hypothetical protein
MARLASRWEGKDRFVGVGQVVARAARCSAAFRAALAWSGLQ